MVAAAGAAKAASLKTCTSHKAGSTDAGVGTRRSVRQLSRKREVSSVEENNCAEKLQCGGDNGYSYPEQDLLKLKHIVSDAVPLLFPSLCSASAVHLQAFVSVLHLRHDNGRGKKTEQSMDPDSPKKKPPMNKYALSCALLASMTFVLLGYELT